MTITELTAAIQEKHPEENATRKEVRMARREMEAEELMAAVQLVEEEGTVEGGSTEGPEVSTSVPIAEGTRLSSEP